MGDERVERPDNKYWKRREYVFLGLFFNWRKIALWGCVGFCHTTELKAATVISLSLVSQAGLPVLPAAPHRLSALYVTVDICRCSFLHSARSLLPLMCAQVHSLFWHLHSFPANRFINTIFLDSIYMRLIYDAYFSLSDLLHLQPGSSFIHLIRTDSTLFFLMAE